MVKKSTQIKVEKPQNESLVPRDSLSHFLAEIHSYPMLSEDDEKQLFKKYEEFGDLEAAKMLVKSHLRLVAKIAMEYRSAYNNILDLMQEGTLGLMQAVKKYDPNKGARLAHYATWWIRSYILKFILDNFRLVKIGTTKTQRKLFYNLMKEEQKLQAMGYYATPKLLSEKLGVRENQITEMQKRLTQPELALQSPAKGDADGGSERTLMDFISNEEESAESQLAMSQSQKILNEKFREFTATLNERDLKIFQERLLSEAPKTLLEIATDYGITKERVRQLEERLITKLREFFKNSGIEIDDLRSNT